tara:strand:+ start:66 stop:317 length:252 start_codon:yes stop_codon:yes gene_type:complete
MQQCWVIATIVSAYGTPETTIEAVARDEATARAIVEREADGITGGREGAWWEDEEVTLDGECVGFSVEGDGWTINAWRRDIEG